jgi:salicylate hydroxylase
MSQVKISRGTASRHGDTLTSIANRSVSFTTLLDCKITDSIQKAHRKTLLEIMTSFIPIENVKFCKRLIEIEQHPSKVVLKFADGDVAEASVLAGADGIKSIVRKHVLEPIYPSQVRPVYADSYCYRAVIPMAEAYEILGDLTDVAKFFFGHRRGGISYRISGGEVSCH